MPEKDAGSLDLPDMLKDVVGDMIADRASELRKAEVPEEHIQWFISGAGHATGYMMRIIDLLDDLES